MNRRKSKGLNYGLLFIASMIILAGLGVIALLNDSQTIQNISLTEFERELVMKNVHVNSKHYVSEELNSEEFGSGVIYYHVDNVYRIITNFHVVQDVNADNTEYVITTYEGINYTATYIKGDDTEDLAILEFESEEDYSIVDLTVDDYYNPMETNDVNYGDVIYAVGNPNNMINVITEGEWLDTVSSLGNYGYRLLEHDAELGNGSSGGGLYTNEGLLIGLNSYILDGKSYAIPVEILLGFILY